MKPTQLSPRSYPRLLVGKGTAQRDINKDITSDSQVNGYFTYRWSPASLTFNIYFYLFLHLYMTRITINNDTPHLKSPKNQNRRAALGRPAIKFLRGLTQSSLLILPWFIRQNNYNKSITSQYQNKLLNQIKTLNIFFTYFLISLS